MRNLSNPAENTESADDTFSTGAIFAPDKHNELDEPDDYDDNDYTYSPISVAPQAELPPPPTPPAKTHDELKKLADEIMQFLLTHGLQVGATELFLLRAAIMGYTELAKIAILAGANIHVQHEGKSILEIAQLTNHPEIVTLINNATMAPGPAIHRTPIEMQDELHGMLLSFATTMSYDLTITANEEIPLCNIVILIREWDDKNDADKANSILELRQKIANQIRNFSGIVAESIFPFVLEAQSCPLWEVCIQAGMPFNNAQNDFKKTPLHMAAENDRHDIATLLLSYGADINSQEAPNKDSPLLLAVRAGNPLMVAFLLQKGAKLNLQNDQKQSAESLGSVNPTHKFASHLIAPHLFSKSAKPAKIAKERLNVKIQIQTKFQDHMIVYEMILDLREKRRQNIETWKAWRDSPEGQECMKTLQLELLDLLDQAPGHLQNDIYKMAQANGYSEMIDACRFLGIGVNPSPVLLSQTLRQQDVAHAPTQTASI